MDLLKFSTPSDAPEWFSRFLEHYNSNSSGGIEVVEEVMDVLDGKQFTMSGLLSTIASGRCRLDKKGLGQYLVSLPSWVVLSTSRVGGSISVALPAYATDTPKKGDVVTLGDSLAKRQIIRVSKLSTHIELEVSGGATLLQAGERVRLAKEKITISKIVRV